MMTLLVVLGLVAGTCVGPGYEPPLEDWDGPSYRVISGQPDALTALSELFDALWEEDMRPVLISGYRSYERQAVLHERDPEWTEPPGCSQHQLGTAFDIGWMGYGLRSPHDAKLWALLEELGPSYGFVIPYDGTGDIPAEPWHLNYTLEVYDEVQVRRNVPL